MLKVNFQDFDYNLIKSSLNRLKKSIFEYEYSTGYYQRLAEGFGFIHAPRKRLPHANPITELFLSFFAENSALNIEQLNKLFKVKVQKELLNAQFIIQTDKDEYLSVFRILPVNNFLLLVPFRKFCEPQVYIGAESLSFQKYIQTSKPPSRILDLATGSGYQLFGLPWQGSNSMLGIDINPNAIAVAKLSALWNKCHWMNFRIGDITKDLKSLSEKFDLITGHLPILPTPENTRYKGTIHNDGGSDGFQIIRKTIPEIPEILESDGSFQLILISLGDEEKPALLPEIKQIFEQNGLRGRVLAIKKIPMELDAYYRGRITEEYDKWINFYKKQNKSYWYRLILRAEKNNKERRKGEILSYIELFRTDFSKPPLPISLEKVRRNINQYLTDMDLLSKTSKQKFSVFSKKLEKILVRTENLTKPISIYGKELFNRFPDIFHNPGCAIRFWGQLVTNQWQPKYLERKLW